MNRLDLSNDIGVRADIIAYCERRRCGVAQIGQRTFRVGDTDYDDIILALPLQPAAA